MTEFKNKGLISIILLSCTIIAGCNNTPSSVISKPVADSKAVSSTAKDTIEQYYSSVVGTWYEVFYSKHDDEYPERWDIESRSKPVVDGYYSSDDKVKIKKDFTYLKSIGIDYLIYDDTNYHMVDNGALALAIDNGFEIASELGEKAPKLCFAGGRPLIEKNAELMKKEMDIFYGYSRMYKDNYFVWNGKPLFVNFNNPINFAYKDERFTIRPAAGMTSLGTPYVRKYNLDSIGMFGWVFDKQYPESEVYGITAGWSRSHNNMGTEYEPVSRENGKRYQNAWLEAVKRKPKTIVITGWNEHCEETGIEAVILKEVVPGREKENLNPMYYQQMTEGYIALKNGYLENFYYRSEDSQTIYQYKDKNLHKVASVPEMTAVIVVPSDYFAWAGIKSDG
jgi:hypothetical protein